MLEIYSIVDDGDVVRRNMLFALEEVSVRSGDRHVSRYEMVNQSIYPESCLPTLSPSLCTMQGLHNYRYTASPRDRAGA